MAWPYLPQSWGMRKQGQEKPARRTPRPARHNPARRCEPEWELHAPYTKPVRVPVHSRKRWGGEPQHGRFFLPRRGGEQPRCLCPQNHSHAGGGSGGEGGGVCVGCVCSAAVPWFPAASRGSRRREEGAASCPNPVPPQPGRDATPADVTRG